ncbi:hypothetical protein GLOIN_2v1632380 [Rhizophagus irregularis DAOM 181602=DAOM 197198]|nr:hypothetical protein GLOIN_2v1632380 [Rhizophagus irregularis DAOM 181602=DAOM 197198]
MHHPQLLALLCSNISFKRAVKGIFLCIFLCFDPTYHYARPNISFKRAVKGASVTFNCLLYSYCEKLLLEGPLDAICSATVIYQTMNRNDLLPYEEVIKIVESAVKSSLKRIRDFQRKESVMEVLTEEQIL